MTEFYVNLSPSDAQMMIENIVNSSVSGEAIDRFVSGEGTNATYVSVYEKYYYRAGNRLTLTSIVTSAFGRTYVRLVSGGGGNGVLFRFDWGAAESLESSVYNGMRAYIIQ